jgi:hypothetical protein
MSATKTWSPISRDKRVDSLIIATCLGTSAAFRFTTPPVRTASAAQVRKPIYTSAIGRWRGYGDALAPLLSALNGDAAAGIASTAPKRSAVTRRKPRSRN